MFQDSSNSNGFEQKETVSNSLLEIKKEDDSKDADVVFNAGLTKKLNRNRYFLTGAMAGGFLTFVSCVL